MAELRIASLVPSLTELICELGGREHLVARTSYCVHPKDSLAEVKEVGGTKGFSFKRLKALAPTHVILNQDENTREMAEALASFVPNVVVTHPLSVQDNFALFERFGELLECQAKARALAQELRAALDGLAPKEPQKVLYLIWRDPWMTVASNTYISDMLRLVGWQSYPNQAGESLGASRYPVVDFSAPWLTELDRVYLSSEPYAFSEAHFPEIHWLLGGLPKPPKVSLIDGEMMSWYGARAIKGISYLKQLQ